MLFQNSGAVPAHSSAYYALLCAGTAARVKTGLKITVISLRNDKLNACISQYFFQCIFATRMTSYHTGITSSCLFYRTFYHLMGNSVGK